MITIRTAEESDAGEILTVQRAAWVTEAQLHNSLDLPPLTQTLADLRIDLRRQHALVAIDGHRIVGIVRASARDGVWHIGRLGVVPDRQGEGIGGRLLSAIETAAPEHVHTFTLFTGPKSLGNIAFYERAGYRRTDSDDGLVHLHKGRQDRSMATSFQVTFDSADPARHAAFWAEALHYLPAPPPQGFDTWDAALDAWGIAEEHRNDRAAIVDPDGAGPRLFFQKVPEPKTAKNRVHLDLRAAAGRPPKERTEALEAECTRLTALGATVVRRLEPDGIDELCIVMQDPEGNEFDLD